jgi:hypothetical protein
MAQSTTEAETIAINTLDKKLVFIKILLIKLELFNQSKIFFYYNNSRVILLAKNFIFHERIKYIKIKYYYIK